MALCDEVGCCLLVQRQPLALRVRAVRTARRRGRALVGIDASPFQSGSNLICSTWNESRLVRVFNAQNKLAVVFAGEHVAEEGSAQATKVQGASGRWRKASANGGN